MINKLLIIEKKLRKIEKLINERSMNRTGEKSNAYSVWQFLMDNGPSTIGKIKANFPEWGENSVANTLSKCVHDRCVFRQEHTYTANPDFVWDDVGVIKYPSISDLEDISFDNTDYSNMSSRDIRKLPKADKEFIKNIPLFKGKVYDAVNYKDIPNDYFVMFKSTGDPNELNFLSEEISDTTEFIKNFNKYNIQLIDGDNFLSKGKRKFKLIYNGKVMTCRWTGGKKIIAGEVKPLGRKATNVLTYLKENSTLEAIKNVDTEYDKDDLIRKYKNFILSDAENKNKEVAESLDDDKLEEYAISALKSADTFYKYMQIDSSKYDGELQCKGERSKLIYDTAQELMKFKSVDKDHWNPADIWFFSKNLSLNKLKNELDSIKKLALQVPEKSDVITLNAYIEELMGGRGNTKGSNMEVIPISLKMVSLKSNATIDRIDADYRARVINNIKQTGLTVTSINVTKTYRNFNILLSNNYGIRVGNSSGGDGSARWELRERGSSAANGNIYKDKYINKYIFEGNSNESKMRNDIVNYSKDELNVFVKELFSLSSKIKLNVTENQIIDHFMKLKDENNNHSNDKEIETYAGMLTNLYYAVKNIYSDVDGTPLLEVLFLSGLKCADYTCPHLKIH